jgi:steroid delta-isomerase
MMSAEKQLWLCNARIAETPGQDRMTTHEDKVAAVEAYVDAFAKGSADAVAELYAEAGTVEDPVGAAPIVGRDAVRAFYARSMQTGAKLTLHGPVRTAADFAAFAFSVAIPSGDGTMLIEVIDTFQFDDAGKVVAMRAYWGPQNMQQP